MLSPNCLLSGGVTTDICVYKLQDGRFKDQFGKNSQQQKVTEKVRHIPPFPFQSPAKLTSDSTTLIMKNGDNKTLEVSSVKTKKMLLKIQKKGDFGISCFDMQDEFIAYSDNIDTQILQFNQTTL